MASPDQPADDLQRPLDPAQLGADQSLELSPQDDSGDMSTVIAKAGTDEAGPTAEVPTPPPGAEARQGSEFAAQRRQGADSSGDQVSAVGQGQGMGRADYNGDEDRGYDQSGYRGGLGASGGREDLTHRQTDPDQNPFTGPGQDQPTAAQSKQLGLNTPSPTDAPAPPANE